MSLADELSGLIGDARVKRIDGFARAHRGDGVGELIAQLARESDPVVVSALVGHIGRHGSPSHLTDLAPFLSHPNPRVVANAIEAMGQLDASAARPMVLPWLISDDHRVRANVLLVLAPQWKDEVLGYLARMSGSPQEPSRVAAIWCLAQLDDLEVDEVLATRLGVEQASEPLDCLTRAFAEQREAQALGPLARVAHDCPARADLARSLIAKIAARCGVSEAEVAQVVDREAQPAGFAGSIARGLKRVKREVRGVRGAMLERKAHAQVRRGRGPAVEPLALWQQPGAIAFAVAALTLLALVLPGRKSGESWVVLDARAVPAHAGAPQAADLRAPAASGPELCVEGQLTGVYGPTLVIRQDYTSYAVRMDAAPAGLSSGQRVAAVARYRGYNRMQGYVELDGRSIQVLQ